MQANPKQFALDISQAPKPSLMNFIPPEKSAGAPFALLEALNEIVTHWKQKQPLPEVLSWIYCWGATGSGKSHLTQALKNEAIQAQCSYLELRHADQTAWQALQACIDKQQLPQACFVENIDQLDTDEQNLLFRLQLEARGAPNVFLFCTGAQSAAGLDLREDICSRLSWGLNFELPVLTDEQKIQAIHQAARERGISLSNEVPLWLLNNFHRDLPSLLSLIEALDHFSLEKKRAITLPLLREFLQSP